MKILVLSDLHIDLWGDSAPTAPSAEYDLVVLAGDIHATVRGIDWAAKTFTCPVMYVHGNHEAYDDAVENVIASLRVRARQAANVSFLNCDEIRFQQVRILGCCLWTDFELGPLSKRDAMTAASHSMRDYQAIDTSADGRLRQLRPADTAAFHAEQKAWLKMKLAEKFDGKTVVVTHMGPLH